MTIAKAKTKGLKSRFIRYESEDAVRSALIEIVIYICFLIATSIVALSVRHVYMYYFNQSIQQLFLNRDTTTAYNYNVGFSQLVTTSDWWSFLENNFLDDLHGVEDDDDEIKKKTEEKDVDEENKKRKKKNSVKLKGVVFLNENHLLGPPRLRQIRVFTGTCHIHDAFSRYFQTCYAEYARSREDMRKEFKGTKFYTLSELDAVSIRGKIGTYIGGGYVKELTFNREQNKAILADLKAKQWIDRGTRIVIVEFGLYNVNTDLFDNVKFIAELPPTGGIIPSSQLQALKLYSVWTEGDYVVLLAAIIFYILIVYYSVEEVRDVHQIGVIRYLCSIWNILDLLILILAYITFVYTIWHPIYLTKILQRLADNPNVYQSLDIVCYWNTIYVNAIAICAFAVWIKLFKYINFNKTLLQFSTTLRRCAKDLLGFGVMFAIVFLAYAQLGLLLFGTTHPDFRNFMESLLTMMRMVLGDFEYSAIEEANRLFGPIYFLTYILLVFFILLNMFLAIINDTYSGVKSEIKSGRNHLQAFLVNIFKKLYNCTMCKRKITQNPEPRAPVVVDELSEVVSSESSAYPKTSASTVAEPMRVRESDLLTNYFEVVTPSEDGENLKRLDGLQQRIKLVEDVLEQLIGNMDRILRRVDYKKKSKYQ